MTVYITYFVHGTTTDNENNISSWRNDIDLSALGVQQSYNLKKNIGDKKFTAVFCSDLQRAMHSAQLMFSDGLNIFPDPRLRECSYGEYNWSPSSIVDPLKEKYISQNFPAGESYEDVQKRMENFCSFLKENYDGQSIAIVAHQWPQLALDVILQWKSREQAFADDWRKTKSWQAGWEYVVE